MSLSTSSRLSGARDGTTLCEFGSVCRDLSLSILQYTTASKHLEDLPADSDAKVFVPLNCEFMQLSFFCLLL